MLRYLRRERGQELVEYALIVPVLLLLVFGIAQLALVILCYNTIGDAARQGARFGVVGDNADHPDLIKAEVYRVTDVAGLDRANLTIPDPVRQADNTIRVEVTYDMSLIIPVLTIRTIALHAVSTKLIELE